MLPPSVSFSAHFAAALERKSPLLRRFERLIAPASDRDLEALARESQRLTRHHFGRTMRLFAPLYLSNEC
jgi:2-iminoacetate synthase